MGFADALYGGGEVPITIATIWQDRGRVISPSYLEQVYTSTSAAVLAGGGGISSGRGKARLRSLFEDHAENSSYRPEPCLVSLYANRPSAPRLR